MIKDHFEPLSVHFYCYSSPFERIYPPLRTTLLSNRRGPPRSLEGQEVGYPRQFRDSEVSLARKGLHIRLKRDLATFSNNLIIEGPSGQTEDLDTSHIYQGHLVGKFDHLSYPFHSTSRYELDYMRNHFNF